MPQTPTASAAPARATSAAATSFGATSRRRPVRATDTVSSDRPIVLVVEPDPRTRSLFEVGLHERGFDVFTAASAEEAEIWLRADRPLPAMVFCESDLIGADGFSFCARIRADDRTADVPVVLLSRQPDALFCELAGGAGADQLLPKPLFLNDVVAMARLMAGRSSSGGRYETNTSELPLAQALRSLLSGVRAGRIELHPGPAWITFRDAQVVDAGFHGMRGDEALSRMLLLARGSYSVRFGPSLTRATMTFGVEELCGHTYPRLQRWERLLSSDVTLDAMRVVDFGRLGEFLPELPADVQALVRLFDGRRTVRDVVLESRLDEVTALEAVARLQAMGVLAAPRDQEKLEVGTRVRALFEPMGGAIVRAAEVIEDVLLGDKDEDGGDKSLYQSTGTLDKGLLQQLAAFRIRQVVEKVDTVPASPELTAFVRAVHPLPHAEPVTEGRFGPEPAAPGLAPLAPPVPEPTFSPTRSTSGAEALSPPLPAPGATSVEAALQIAAQNAGLTPPPAVTPPSAAPASTIVPAIAPMVISAAPAVSPVAAGAPGAGVEALPVAGRGFPVPATAMATSAISTAPTGPEVAPARAPDPASAPTVIAPIPLTTPVAADSSLDRPDFFAPDDPQETSAAPHAAEGDHAHTEDAFFRREMDALDAHERAPDRKWLVAGIVGTAAVAVLAGIAVVVTTRAPQSQPTPRPPAIVAPAPDPAPAAPAEAATGEAAAAPSAEGGSMAISAQALAEDAQGANAAEDALAAVTRGVELYESGQYKDALAELEKVTEQHPTLAVGWVYLGLARFDRHDSRGAERAAMKALELEPGNGKAMMLLASVYAAARQPTKARVELERYLKLHPKGPWAAEAKRLLAFW